MPVPTWEPAVITDVLIDWLLDFGLPEPLPAPPDGELLERAERLGCPPLLLAVYRRLDGPTPYLLPHTFQEGLPKARVLIPLQEAVFGIERSPMEGFWPLSMASTSSALAIERQTGAVTEGWSRRAPRAAQSLAELFERRLEALMAHQRWDPERGVWMGPDDLLRRLGEEGDEGALARLAELVRQRLGAFKALVLPYIGRFTPFLASPSRSRFGRTQPLKPAFNPDVRLMWTQQDIDNAGDDLPRAAPRRVADVLGGPPLWKPHAPDAALASALGEPVDALAQRLLRWQTRCREAFAANVGIELGSIGVLSAQRQRDIYSYAPAPQPNVIPAHWRPRLRYAPAFLRSIETAEGPARKPRRSR